MHSNWHNQTCESCRFRTGLHCQRFPPTQEPEERLNVDGGPEKHTYPVVAEYREWLDEVRNYNEACAEFDPAELRYA